VPIVEKQWSALSKWASSHSNQSMLLGLLPGSVVFRLELVWDYEIKNCVKGKG
jgi:hypothetical protein